MTEITHPVITSTRLGARVKWRLVDIASLLFPPPLLGAASSWPPRGPRGGHTNNTIYFHEENPENRWIQVLEAGSKFLASSFPNLRYLELGVRR